MKTLFTKAALALALGATALTVAAPADAQRYGGYRHNDGTGTAIVAGIAGLAIGAALASSNNRRDGYYEDRGYYDQRGYDQYRHYHRHHWHDRDRDHRWDDRDGRDSYYNGGGGYYGNGYQEGYQGRRSGY